MATSYSAVVIDEVTFSGGTAFACEASDGAAQIKSLALDATADRIVGIYLEATCNDAGGDAGYAQNETVPIAFNTTFDGAKVYSNSDSFFIKISGAAGSYTVRLFFNNCGGADEPLERVLIHGSHTANDGKRKNMDITKWNFHLVVLSVDLP